MLSLLLTQPSWAAGWQLFRQQGGALFLVQLLSTCLFGFLMKQQTDSQRSVSELAQKNAALRESLEQTIGALSTATAQRDPGTAGHELRTTELALAIGAEIGMTADRLEGLKLAALVHDVGQLQLPAEILTRPRKLNAEEFNLVKLHANSGFEILKEIQFPWPVAEIVRQHHEDFDGGGYPRGLVGAQILLEARVIRVADSMDAMLSHRPFRRAYDLGYALDSLQAQQGKCYDPQVVAACIRLFREKNFSISSLKKAA